MTDQLRRRSTGAPTAQSLLLTVLGEYVLPQEGQPIWQETLISALSALGYKSHAARQSLARATADGWLVAERQGRRSRVTLTGAATEMLEAGADRIYRFGEDYSWDQKWVLVILKVPERQRKIRHRARTQLAWAGFGSLGGGLWISPHASREAEATRLADDDSAEILSFRSTLGAMGRPEQIVQQAWNLDELLTTYQGFLDRFEKLRPKTPDGVFVAHTLLVHEWRKFPFLDPDLPRELMPDGWPRDRALALFRRCHEQWKRASDEYFKALNAVPDAAQDLLSNSS